MGLRHFCWLFDGLPKTPVLFRLTLLLAPSCLDQYSRTDMLGVSVDHASAVAAPKSDPIFLHVKAGMIVIVTDTESAWHMADVV